MNVSSSTNHLEAAKGVQQTLGLKTIDDALTAAVPPDDSFRMRDGGGVHITAYLCYNLLHKTKTLQRALFVAYLAPFITSALALTLTSLSLSSQQTAAATITTISESDNCYVSCQSCRCFLT